MFSPQQEGYLGEAVVEQMQRDLRVYRQPELTEPIERIAKRLNRYFPDNRYQFQFSLIEIPEANAFVVPGGHVFLSRRLIAFVQSEDELAGVIGHEMGHALARQASVNMTQVFRSVLKIDKVGDRQDIFNKFNQVIESSNRNRAGGRPVDDEVVADRVSLEAIWRAGYDPQALPVLLDRLAENKGATGNFFSDLFGLTRPESKRLREMLKTTGNTSQTCRLARTVTDEEAFRSWQKKVGELRPEDLTSTSTSLSPVLTLRPKLRPEINLIRFSPDGRFLLAQDDSGINIMRREPFEYLFRIPALEGRSAIFLNDSARVAFETGGSRLEIWTIESRTREKLWTPKESLHCSDLKPSPDGKYAACLSGLFGKDVTIINIANDSEIARHSTELGFGALLLGVLQGPSYRPVHGEFSPDGRYFLSSSGNTDPCCDTWAFNFEKQKEASLSSSLRNALGGNFAFAGPALLAVVNRTDIRSSGLFSWPEGKQVEKFTIPPFPLKSVTKGATVLLQPFEGYAVAALSLEDKALFQVNSNPALDRFEDTGAAERLTGEIALYPGRKTQPSATLQLPDADLGHLRSAVVSPDLRWLAISLRQRSAVWDLTTGQAVQSDPFDGGSISADGIWTATFEGREKQANGKGFKKVFSRVNADLGHRQVLNKTQLSDDNEEGRTVRYSGKYEVTALTDKSHKASISVTDTASGEKKWTREMASLPTWQVGEELVLEYTAGDKALTQMLKENPELKRRYDSFPKKDTVSVLEIVALNSGTTEGRVLFDHTSDDISLKTVHVAGRNVFVEDSRNRTLAYSMETGERSGQQFGHVVAVNETRNLAAVQNEPGTLTVYDGSMKRIASFPFPGNIIYAGFDGDGKRLLTLTGSQEVFIQNIP